MRCWPWRSKGRCPLQQYRLKHRCWRACLARRLAVICQRSSRAMRRTEGKICAALLIGSAVALFAQSNSGELRLRVTDPAGRGVQATVHVLSDANQYSAVLETDSQGNLNIARLPYGVYRLEI